MDDLPFEEEAFDLIWAEGSVFVMVFEAGIQCWRAFLRERAAPLPFRTHAFRSGDFITDRGYSASVPCVFIRQPESLAPTARTGDAQKKGELKRCSQVHKIFFPVKK